MAKDVHFTVTNRGLKSYSIAVDGVPISLSNGKGKKNLSDGEHRLLYFGAGAPGKSMGISGVINPNTPSEKEVVSVGNTSIPDNQITLGNAKKFTV